MSLGNLALSASMPGLTGLEVAEGIRARGCTTSIVMISGHAEPDDQRRAGEAGVLFMRKPLSFAQFKATMAGVEQSVGVAS